MGSPLSERSSSSTMLAPPAPSGEVPTTFAGMAKNAEAFVDALGLRKIDLFGFSIGGMVAQQITPLVPAYAATRGALGTRVRHLGTQLGMHGIRVNAVTPGVIETDMSNFTKPEAGRNLALNMQPLKRIGKPEGVPNVIAFLASDGARWIAGANTPGGSKL